MLVKMSFIPIYYTLVLCIAAKLPSLSASSSVPFAAFDLLFCFVASRTLEQMIRRFHVTVSLPPAPLRFQLQYEKSTRASRHSSQLAGIVLGTLLTLLCESALCVDEHPLVLFANTFRRF